MNNITNITNLNIPNTVQESMIKFVEEITAFLGNHVKQIILYGSYARGDYTDDSDIDVMILTDLTDEEMQEKIEIIDDLTYEIEYKYNVMFSTIFKNINDFNHWLKTINFYNIVNKEGVKLSNEF